LENRFLRLIEVLVRHDERFIVVGGVAADLRRVPVSTQDFDLVHDRAADNVAALLLALDELGAVYRDDPRGPRPGESHLEGPGNQLLRSGTLVFDVLGSIDFAGGYQELLPDAEPLDVGGHRVLVLKLEKLIEIKRLLTRPKDQLMLLQLEAALEERKRREGSSS
jgi:hypothetical protein